jgi:hypothetical protein
MTTPNEIPFEKVNGKVICKAQVNWFNMVHLGVQAAIMEGYASKRSEGMFKDFEVYMKTSDYYTRLKNRKDIRKANNLLSSIIKDLE